MDNYVKFGVSQGRLVASKNGQLQCFPQENWQLEFTRARNLDLGFIELLVERQNNEQNPFWTPEGRESIRQSAKENGLELYSCCFDYVIDHDLTEQDTLFSDQLLKFFAACEDLQISIVVLPLLEKSNLTKNNTEKFVPIIQDIADKFLPKSTELCIESLLPAAELSVFLSSVDRDSVSCVYDTGNRIVGGANLTSEILLLNSWIKHLHIKDKNADGENVILGTGLVDFQSVFRVLKEIKYNGYFNFETTRGKSALKTMAYHQFLCKFFLEEANYECSQKNSI